MFGRGKTASGDTAQIPVPSGETKVADLGAETLLYSLGKTTMIQLDSCGALVWKLCDGERSVDDIVSLLSDAYPEGSDHLEGDVWQILTQLDQEGILTLQSR